MNRKFNREEILAAYDKGAWYRGFVVKSGWGVDCPGGDDVSSTVLQRSQSGRDLALYAWMEPIRNDDDPVCVCGVAKSEHILCGCGEFEVRR